MEFEWNEAKNQSNIKKHGIDFSNLYLFFAKNPKRYFVSNSLKRFNEQRFFVIGAFVDDKQSEVIIVFCTSRNENIRIISARRANKKEIKIL